MPRLSQMTKSRTRHRWEYTCPGSVASVDGNKLTVDFDKAGRKMVLDSFVQKAG